MDVLGQKPITVSLGQPAWDQHGPPWGITLIKLLSPTLCTTRVTTHTCYMYCCHNAGVDRRDFQFSVLN